MTKDKLQEGTTGNNPEVIPKGSKKKKKKRDRLPMSVNPQHVWDG